MAQDPTAAGATEPTGGAGAIDTTAEDRDALASQLVDRFTLWSGAAGLIPIPVVDIATVAGVQLQMLRRFRRFTTFRFPRIAANPSSQACWVR